MDKKTELITILRNLADEMHIYPHEISLYVHYNSWREFGNYLHQLVNDLEGSISQRKRAKHELRMIFLPTSDWDDSGGLPGYDPDKILKLLSEF